MPTKENLELIRLLAHEQVVQIETPGDQAAEWIRQAARTIGALAGDDATPEDREAAKDLLARVY